eukprot:scaffold78141_cov32-Tisochrysis_lutea.AAC.5
MLVRTAQFEDRDCLTPENIVNGRDSFLGSRTLKLSYQAWSHREHGAAAGWLQERSSAGWRSRHHARRQCEVPRSRTHPETQRTRLQRAVPRATRSRNALRRGVAPQGAVRESGAQHNCTRRQEVVAPRTDDPPTGSLDRGAGSSAPSDLAHHNDDTRRESIAAPVRRAGHLVVQEHRARPGSARSEAGRSLLIPTAVACKRHATDSARNIGIRMASNGRSNRLTFHRPPWHGS